MQIKTIKLIQELKQRLCWYILTFFVFFGVLFFFRNEAYSSLAKPLLNRLPVDGKFIAANISQVFYVPIQLSLVLAFCLSFPVLLYHIWRFVAPALYKQEKKFFLWLVFTCCLLFIAGISFAYCIFIPLVLDFLIACAPSGVAILPDIASYLSFILSTHLVCGLAFQIPVITHVIIKRGWLGINAIRKLRPYIIVGAFVSGMLLTPPDVISQIALAVPIWLLFECGLISSRLQINKKGYLNKQ